jgi:hypothetical protein
MLDILQLRISLDEFEQLRLCQTHALSHCHAAFTVAAPRVIWPGSATAETPFEERINVRGWFPLLDRIADEFLIFRPKGGAFHVSREGASYPVERSARGLIFLQFEIGRLAVVQPPETVARRVSLAN